MEINGTWYALRTIDAVKKIYYKYSFDIVLCIGGTYSLEIVHYETLEQAEQARLKIIKQLENN